ncbi:MAG: hypothetical protein ABIJ23_05200 [Candidatus Magasanikbacteria bacterium]
MRRNIEQIEIKEPPIQELTKKRSCLKRTCFTGCGCIVIFLAASLFLLKFATGHKTKELKNLPDYFPSNIPVYDADNIQKITFTSGKERGRALEIAAFVPKLILSPIILNLNKKPDIRNPEQKDSDLTIKTGNTWQDFVSLMQEPVVDHRDSLQVEWVEMPAEPWFVQSYYETELKNTGYQTERNNKENNIIRELNFELNEIEGILYIEDDPTGDGTDYVSLIIKTPLEQ